MQQWLKVKWSGVDEFIAFDEDKDFDELTTIEQWKDEDGNTYEVTYNVDAEFKKTGKNGKNRTLKLIYEYSKQTDPKIKNQPAGEVRYGTSVINWDDGSAIGKAYWTDEDRHSGKDEDGEFKVSVMGGQKIPTGRKKTSVLGTSRPNQTKLREALLNLDKQCVLTGVKCRTVLEVAHLVPVAKGGHELIENGIILRADLHLLFDAGLIWFDVSGDRAAVKCSKKCSTDRYVTNLDGKFLPDNTFQRVKHALLERAKSLGGRGTDATEQNL